MISAIPHSTAARAAQGTPGPGRRAEQQWPGGLHAAPSAPGASGEEGKRRHSSSQLPSSSQPVLGCPFRAGRTSSRTSWSQRRASKARRVYVSKPSSRLWLWACPGQQGCGHTAGQDGSSHTQHPPQDTNQGTKRHGGISTAICTSRMCSLRAPRTPAAGLGRGSPITMSPNQQHSLLSDPTHLGSINSSHQLAEQRADRGVKVQQGIPAPHRTPMPAGHRGRSPWDPTSPPPPGSSRPAERQRAPRGSWHSLFTQSRSQNRLEGASRIWFLRL